jgi:signal transduction histidine kinase
LKKARFRDMLWAEGHHECPTVSMARILVADEDRSTRQRLLSYLGGAGHTLIEAEDGWRAVEMSREADLVLLDIQLPGLDGFAATRRIKEIAESRFLPVVLTTPMEDDVTKREGLRAGADDFLIKPVEEVELRLRVGNLLALKAQHMTVAEKNEELVELNRFKEEMSAMLVHDLKNPASIVLSNLGFVIEEVGDTKPEVNEALRDCDTAMRRLLGLCEYFLDIFRLEGRNLELRFQRIEVTEWLWPIIHLRSTLAHSRQVTLELKTNRSYVFSGDEALLTRIIENVLDNGLRFTPAGGVMSVQPEIHDGKLQIRVGNTGPAIPAEERKLIFERYGRGRDGRGGPMNLGLGLYFCRLVAEAHRGRIWVEETEKFPTVFVIELPM